MSFETAPPDEFLTAEELLEYDDIKEEDVQIPEWGNKKVRIRSITLEQMAQLATKASRPGPPGHPDIVDRETSVALTVYYGMIKPKLSLEQVGMLRAKNAGAVTRIVQAINALGPTPEAIDEATKSAQGELNGAVSIFPSARTGDDSI